MDLSSVLTDPMILEAAWLRVRTWYYRGEWIPQPDFARWELDADVMLEELGQALASRNYSPSPMLLLPHAKKKGRLRHYCQPSVRDQVAFTVFGLLLAPLMEECMHPFSFGNRWYRGITRRDEGNTLLWSPRKWSLADRNLYQPYRRAHGLFRRAASWTVDAMLGSEPAKESSLGPIAKPEDFGDDLLPKFVKATYWQQFPKIERVFWARFDLKLAFPSVRIEALRHAMRSVAAEVLPDPSTGMLDLSKLFLVDNLNLFNTSLRYFLLERTNVESLVDYLCDLLCQIRYEPFEGSDKLFFPNDLQSPNPPFLPWGDGKEHPGLPTGLAICGMLMNVYLHSIDGIMEEWYRPNQMSSPHPGHPAAFLRFADDMVLLAGTMQDLVAGIGCLMDAIASKDSAVNLNLQMNWEKSHPQSVADLLTEYRKREKRTKLDLLQWTLKTKSGKTFQSKLEQDAITEETRGPFVTELVERLSDLGTEKQSDLLPAQAKLRLARLQEVVLLKPDDSVVPRETQLVFAANHLVRAWLPEENRQSDASLLTEIRRSVYEALRCASDKPRLWRAVWRAAIRRPTAEATLNDEELQREDEAASKWVLSVISRFSESADCKRFVPPGLDPKGELREWEEVWPRFASFQRSALWRAFTSVVHDVRHHVQRLKEEQAFAPPHSWLYRSTDEQTLPRVEEWLYKISDEVLNILYVDTQTHLPKWESESLALAFMAITPRRIIPSFTNLSHDTFTEAVASIIRRYHPQWNSLAFRLNSPKWSQTSPSMLELITLAAEGGIQDEEAARMLVRLQLPPRELLRILQVTNWRKYAATEVREAAQQELFEHPQRLAAARTDGVAAIRREWNRYQFARQNWLASGGAGQ